MPQRRTSIKELRKNHTRHLHNQDIKTDLKKTLKKFEALVKGNNKNEAEKHLSVVYKKLDKAAKRNILHKNKAARQKSFFRRQLATLQ